MLRQTTLQLKFITLLIISVSTNVWAQQPGTSLSKQYEDVVAKAGSYQGFKEIKENKLEFLWKSMSDSLQKERQLLKEAQAQLLKNGQTANKSKAGLATAQLELEKSEARVNQVSFLGIYLEKNNYNLIMWGLVIILAACLAIAVYLTRKSVKEAHYRIGLFNDLSEEFQRHKTNSNEREKKLARELQTERNKMAEFSGHSR
jgi:cell division protein FtsL